MRIRRKRRRITREKLNFKEVFPMSAIIILTPLVIAAWPAISAAVVGAVGAMGYVAANTVANEMNKTKENLKTSLKNSVDIEVGNSEILKDNMAREQELVFTKGDVTVIFKRDVRGKLNVCVKGENTSKAELERIGKEIAGKVTQQYIYNRVVSEIQDSEFSIIDQEVDEKGAIKIHVRNWES
jgi:hypothetical protein